ncbi:MAG: glycine cleavage system protein GcvH [Planctomycetota bacterium]|nr:glycine cleavage system protein GcvH [Planctomycetota bacterium]
MRPKDLKYTETHEWVRIEGDTATIGITDYAISQLSDLVHIELPEAGEHVEQDAPFGEIESVKTVSDLVAPLTGEIVGVNEELLTDVSVLAKDPYEEGWLVKLKIEDPSEVPALLSFTDYEEFVESEKEGEEEEEE